MAKSSPTRSDIIPELDDEVIGAAKAGVRFELWTNSEQS